MKSSVTPRLKTDGSFGQTLAEVDAVGYSVFAVPTVDLYLAFVFASAIVIAMPGPSVLFVVARSIEHGTRAGLVSVVGVAGGALMHTVLVAFGLAQIFQASPLGFTIVKDLGGVYLIYLGIRTLFRPTNSPTELAALAPGAVRRILLDGFMVELLNPKTALFFLAFLPQFVSTTRGSPVAPQLLLLGGTFVLLGFVSDGVYCIGAARIARMLKRSTAFQRAEKYLAGSTYLGLGLATLLYTRKSKA